MLRFTYGERKNWSNIKKSENIMSNDCLENFLLLFISLLTAPVVKNNHILAGIYFIFLKTRPRPNLKGLQYQILTSVKRSEK